MRRYNWLAASVAVSVSVLFGSVVGFGSGVGAQTSADPLTKRFEVSVLGTPPIGFTGFRLFTECRNLSALNSRTNSVSAVPPGGGGVSVPVTAGHTCSYGLVLDGPLIPLASTLISHEQPPAAPVSYRYGLLGSFTPQLGSFAGGGSTFKYQVDFAPADGASSGLTQPPSESLTVKSSASALVGTPVDLQVEGGQPNGFFFVVDPSRRSPQTGSFEVLGESRRFDANGRFVGSAVVNGERTGPLLAISIGPSWYEYGFSDVVSVSPDPAARSIPIRVVVKQPDLSDFRSLRVDLRCSGLAGGAQARVGRDVPIGTSELVLVAAPLPDSRCEASFSWYLFAQSQRALHRFVSVSSGDTRIGSGVLIPTTPTVVGGIPLVEPIEITVEPVIATINVEPIGDPAGAKEPLARVQCELTREVPPSGRLTYSVVTQAGYTPLSMLPQTTDGIAQVPNSCFAEAVLGDADRIELEVVDVATGRFLPVQRLTNPDRVRADGFSGATLIRSRPAYLSRLQVRGIGVAGTSAPGSLRCNGELYEATFELKAEQVTEVLVPAGRSCGISVGDRFASVVTPLRTSCVLTVGVPGCAVSLSMPMPSSPTSSSTSTPTIPTTFSTTIPTTIPTTAPTTAPTTVAPSTVPTTMVTTVPVTTVPVTTVPVTTAPVTTALVTTFPPITRVLPLILEAPDEVDVGEQFTVTVRGLQPSGVVEVTAGSITLGWAAADASGVAVVRNALWSQGVVTITARRHDQGGGNLVATRTVNLGSRPPTTRTATFVIEAPKTVKLGEVVTVVASGVDQSTAIAVEAGGVTLGWARPVGGVATVTNGIWSAGVVTITVSEIRNNEVVSTQTTSIVVTPR